MHVSPLSLLSLVAAAADEVSVLSGDSNISSPSSTSSTSASSSGSKRAAYTLKFKRDVVAAVDGMCATSPGATVGSAMAYFSLPTYYYSKWKKDCLRAIELSADSDSRVSVHGNSRKLHPGRDSVLEDSVTAIRLVVESMRDQALPVTTRRVRIEANKVSESFKGKSVAAKRAIVHRLCKRMGLSHRASTHTAQKHHKETELLSKMFMDKVQVRLEQIPCELISNMDQTATPFCSNPRTTLQAKGSRTVHISAAVGKKMRCTTHIGIDRSGKMMTPYIIFKGMPGGRIEKRELPTFSDHAYYAMQKNAWCDETCMLDWLNKSFKDWVDARKVQFPDIIPVLILDAFAVHMLTSVVAKVESLGCDVIFIPGGCTYLCQPVDVGIN